MKESTLVDFGLRKSELLSTGQYFRKRIKNGMKKANLERDLAKEREVSWFCL